jgi:hypothetical protein
MRSDNTATGLTLVRGTLEDLERAAFLACFGEQADFDVHLARLRAAREVPAPRLTCITPRERAT